MRGVLVHSVMETPNIFFSGSSSRSQRETRKSGRIPKSQSRRGHKVHKSPKFLPANYISKPPSLSPSRRLGIEVPAAAMSISPYSTGSSSSSGTSVGGGIVVIGVGGWIVFIGLVLALIVATIAGCMYCSRRKKRSGRLNGAGQSEAPSSALLLHHPSDDPSIINGQRRVGVVQLPSSSSFAPRSFSLEQLSVATNNFSRSELLGRGGFGRVYKGTLPAGNSSQLVAVKCISHDSRQGSKEFLAEVNIISDIRHKNVVRLLGWCSHEDGRLFLVYDYLPKGSLDKLLFDKERFVALSWSQRFSIMLGLGSALRYLHEECERVIIHRDVKSSNVLLDENFEAKLGDFGLSRQVEQGAFAHTTDVAGTEGYMAPEVIYTFKATKEADVYSFGVVLAEVACGRRAMDRSLGSTGMLVDWVWNLHSQRRLLDGADERLNRDFDAEQVNRVLIVALACSHPDPNSRPTMSRAMEFLHGKTHLPVIPASKPTPNYGPPPPMNVQQILQD